MVGCCLVCVLGRTTVCFGSVGIGWVETGRVVSKRSRRKSSVIVQAWCVTSDAIRACHDIHVKYSFFHRHPQVFHSFSTGLFACHVLQFFGSDNGYYVNLDGDIAVVLLRLIMLGWGRLLSPLTPSFPQTLLLLSPFLEYVMYCKNFPPPRFREPPPPSFGWYDRIG